MTRLPQLPADRPLPDRDRRRGEFLALLQAEQQDTVTPSVRSHHLPGVARGTAPHEIIDIAVDATPRGFEPLRPRSRSRSRRGWFLVAGAAAAVAISAVAVDLNTRTTAPPAPAASVPRSLDGIPVATAQNALTDCLKAGQSGKLTNGYWLGSQPTLIDAASSYTVVLATARNWPMENGLYTLYVGKGPGGQLASCATPATSVPGGPQAWLSTSTALPSRALVSLEFWQTGRNSYSDGSPIFTIGLIGRCATSIARVTVQYPGVRPYTATVADGVWFTQVPLAGSGDPADAQSAHPVVRGYAADGKLLYSS